MPRDRFEEFQMAVPEGQDDGDGDAGDGKSVDEEDEDALEAAAHKIKEKFRSAGITRDRGHREPAKRRMSIRGIGGSIYGRKTELQLFLDKMAKISTDTDKIAENVNQLKQLHVEALTVTTATAATVESRMAFIQTENKKLAKRIRDLLRKEQDKLAMQTTVGGGAAEDAADLVTKTEREHLRRTQLQANSARFMEVWAEYNEAQIDYRDKRRKEMVKKMKVTGVSLDEEEIEEMLDQGRSKEFFFAKGILEETRVAKQQLSQIEARHGELLRLEQSLVEIKELFLELEALVSQQGEVIDSIERSVTGAREWVESGKDCLQEAKVYQKKARRRKVWFSIACVVVALIVIIIILSSTGMI